MSDWKRIHADMKVWVWKKGKKRRKFDDEYWRENCKLVTVRDVPMLQYKGRGRKAVSPSAVLRAIKEQGYE